MATCTDCQCEPATEFYNGSGYPTDTGLCETCYERAVRNVLNEGNCVRRFTKGRRLSFDIHRHNGERLGRRGAND